jgi:hypothetical protein
MGTQRGFAGEYLCRRVEASAMLTSDDGDVRAYVVATLGWLRYVVLQAVRGEDALRHVDEYERIWSLMW